MNNYKLYFDGKHRGVYEKNAFYKNGNSPYLVSQLIHFLDSRANEINEISVAFYLFNNKMLADYLINLAEAGVVINIITTPLEGYDKRSPKQLTSFKTGEKTNKKFSKFDLAENVYSDIAKSKVNLYIFDHVYLRSKNIKPFSRGKAPYSLHIKTALIVSKNGDSYTFLTSSNFAVRDLVKEELGLLIKNQPRQNEVAKEFFKNLIQNCERHSSNKQKYHFKASYKIPIQSNQTCDSVYFTTPFYNNSPINIASEILDILKGAQKKITIVAQHIATFSEVLNSLSDVNVELLSQTYVDETHVKNKQNDYVKVSGKNKKCRVPANTSSFKRFVKDLKTKRNRSYYFNENIHLKFIIVDDTVIFSTGNFTETQFLYIENVDIREFSQMPEVSYNGTFCEVNQFLIFRNNKNLAKEMTVHFEKLKRLDETVKVF